jgi:hypothetical protein
MAWRCNWPRQARSKIARDGDLGTQWSSLEHEHSYWQTNFQQPVAVAQVAIWGRGGGDGMLGRLEFSDGSSVEFGSLNGDGCRRAISFQYRTTTSVRFQVTGMGNRNTTGFREIEAYGYSQYPDGDYDCNRGGPPGPSAPASGCPQRGQVCGLARGVQVRTGSGFSFPSTIPAPWNGVPEDNWLVLIQNDPSSPRCADGWEWWNIDRGAVDHVGGTGWAAIRQKDCGTSVGPPGPPPPPPPAGCRDGNLVPGGAIEAKWCSFRGSSSFLGEVTLGERDAAPSPYGTKGVYAAFRGGHINWSGPYGAFALYGAIDGLNLEMAGSSSWLGFPKSDEYDWNGGRRQDFEGGYIYWDGTSAQPLQSEASSNPNNQYSAKDNQQLIDYVKGSYDLHELELVVERYGKPRGPKATAYVNEAIRRDYINSYRGRVQLAQQIREILESTWVDELAVSTDELVNELLSTEVHLQPYEDVMRANPALRDSVGTFVDVATGLDPEGNITGRDLAINAALIAIPVGKVGQVGLRGTAAVAERAGNTWILRYGGRVLAQLGSRVEIRLLDRGVLGLWDRASFDSAEETLAYHYKMHVLDRGINKSVEQYTSDGADFFTRHSQDAGWRSTEISGDRSGVKLSIAGEGGGVYTSQGKIVTFFYP